MLKKQLNDIHFKKSHKPNFEIECMTLSYLFKKTKSNILENPQRIHFYQIILVTKGVGQHMIDFKNYAISPGAMIVLRAGEVQAFLAVDKIEGYLLLFSQKFYDDMAIRMKGLIEVLNLIFHSGSIINFSKKSLMDIIHLVDFLITDIEREHTFPEQALQGIFCNFICKITDFNEFKIKLSAYKLYDDVVMRFFFILEKSFKQERTTEFYAKQLGMAIRTLDRHLVKCTKKTCKRLIMDRILLEAKRLLTDLNTPVKIIGEDLGFTETANFTRLFKLESGFSPTDFRKKWILNH